MAVIHPQLTRYWKSQEAEMQLGQGALYIGEILMRIRDDVATKLQGGERRGRGGSDPGSCLSGVKALGRRACSAG